MRAKRGSSHGTLPKRLAALPSDEPVVRTDTCHASIIDGCRLNHGAGSARGAGALPLQWPPFAVFRVRTAH
jgi:hypothetical protein